MEAAVRSDREMAPRTKRREYEFNEEDEKARPCCDATLASQPSGRFGTGSGASQVFASISHRMRLISSILFVFGALKLSHAFVAIASRGRPVLADVLAFVPNCMEIYVAMLLRAGADSFRGIVHSKGHDMELLMVGMAKWDDILSRKSVPSVIKTVAAAFALVALVRPRLVRSMLSRVPG